MRTLSPPTDQVRPIKEATIKPRKNFFKKRKIKSRCFDGKKYLASNHMIDEIHGVFHFILFQQVCPMMINRSRTEIKHLANNLA